MNDGSDGAYGGRLAQPVLLVDGQIVGKEPALRVVQAQDADAGYVYQTPYARPHTRLDNVERRHHVVPEHHVRRVVARGRDGRRVHHRAEGPLADQGVCLPGVGQVSVNFRCGGSVRQVSGDDIVPGRPQHRHDSAPDHAESTSHQHTRIPSHHHPVSAQQVSRLRGHCAGGDDDALSPVPQHPTG
jgi:hypothetical protein